MKTQKMRTTVKILSASTYKDKYKNIKIAPFEKHAKVQRIDIIQHKTKKSRGQK